MLPLRKSQELKRGAVRIASSGGFAIEFLPGVIAEFCKRHEGISFKLHVSTAADVSATAEA
jgi:DNA-binding transcriptional LysR family regulator